jgi:hypothetical protein
MMMTDQGKELLGDFYFEFRVRYADNNPGCNENDVERAFLRSVGDMVYGVRQSRCCRCFEQIR